MCIIEDILQDIISIGKLTCDYELWPDELLLNAWKELQAEKNNTNLSSFVYHDGQRSSKVLDIQISLMKRESIPHTEYIPSPSLIACNVGMILWGSWN